MNPLLDPNVAYMLLVTGSVLALLALFSPGTGLLEVGALFILVLAGFGIYNQPINWWALAVLVLGVVPFVLALRRWRRWWLLGVSLAALVVGSMFLMRDPNGGPAVNPFLALFISAVSVTFLWVVGHKSLEAMGLKPLNARESLEDQLGEARTDIRGEGTVYIGGEEWTARSDEFIPLGARVKVVRREGLVIYVEAVRPERK
jgi:membrane-bound serine protease (ClpP class)